MDGVQTLTHSTTATEVMLKSGSVGDWIPQIDYRFTYVEALLFTLLE